MSKYSDTLKANADMITKAKLMLENDKGMTETDINSNLIRAKIELLKEEKQFVLGELSKDYTRNTHILNEKYNTKDTKNHLIKNQQKEIARNNKKLNFIKNDILTLKRQLEISENQYGNKSFLLFILKNIFILLLLLLLLLLLVKSNRILMKNAIIIGSILSAFFGLVIIFNLVLSSIKDHNIYGKYNWVKPILVTKPKKSMFSFMPSISLSASVKTD
tara:strand:- start:21 stop:674 length:654 start_codon:yes stop_codon:yes gene_type:complete